MRVDVRLGGQAGSDRELRCGPTDHKGAVRSASGRIGSGSDLSGGGDGTDSFRKSAHVRRTLYAESLLRCHRAHVPSESGWRNREAMKFV